MKYVLLLALGLGLLSCGSVASPPRPDVGFYDRTFTRASNVELVIRVADALRDPIYGPHLHRALAKEHGLLAVLAGADEIDASCAVVRGVRSRDLACISVVYGIDIDPATVRDGSSTVFGAANRLPSGAVEYGVEHESEFVMFAVRGAWIFAHGDVIDRLRATLGDSPPPRLDLEPTALAAVSIRASALDSSDFSRHDLEGNKAYLASSFDEGELLIARGGDILARVWFTQEDAAKILEGELLAATKVGARCDDTCRMARSVLERAVDVDRNGAFVRVRVHLPEAALRKLL